jgi:hypothetical protein
VLVGYSQGAQLVGDVLGGGGGGGGANLDDTNRYNSAALSFVVGKLSGAGVSWSAQPAARLAHAGPRHTPVHDIGKPGGAAPWSRPTTCGGSPARCHAARSGW